MQQFRLRLLFMAFVLLIGAAVVVSRLFTIQVLESKRYSERSRDQTQQRRILSARRGSLLDRSGKVLGASMQNTLLVDPVMLGATARKESESARVRRVYPLGDIAGQLLGYIGTDGYGLGGAELAFDRYLRGEDGWIILQRDGRNHRYRKIGLPVKEPRNGDNVLLTIDINIQKVVQEVLKQTVSSLRAKGGMCIVMDPQDGAVLAMANEPSFNPNIPERYSMRQRQNGCLSTIYEPGSTFKVVTASIAMQENIKKEEDLIFGDNGAYKIFDQVIRDHKPYGYLTFAKALSYSSNVCFAKIANEIGNEKFYRYIRDYGFGTKTAIDLPGEETGVVHPIKMWSGRTRVTMAMGQEISATLLQMTLPFAAVANGGVLVSPRICQKIVAANGVDVDSGSYQPVRRVIDASVARRLRYMMKDVVDNGTGKKARLPHIEVAGKTGTSQKPDSGGYSQKKSWSSFIGFVPVEKPLLLCAVMIDEPANGEMGGVAAAPVFRKIIMQIISHPELEFAEKMLHNNQVPQPVKRTVPGIMTKGDKQLPSDIQGVEYFAAATQLPDCIGKDLRDAVNLINKSGLRPFAVGSGRVKRQFPAAGTAIHTAEICTLYCSFEG